MKLKLTLLLLLCQLSMVIKAQNIGVNNPTPDASSILDLTSTSRGFLLPRMTTLQRTGIATPATSLLVYDITLSRFMFYNGASWNGLLSSGTSWETIGNSGTTPGTNFLGTIDKKDVVFKSFNTEVMRLDTNLAMGINQPAPDIKSILHITSTTKGVLLPRMTSLQRTTLIPNGSATDAARDGLLVYDNNLNAFLSWNADSLRWDTIIGKIGGSGLYWQLLGNTGTNPATNFIGTTDNTDLVFRTNNIERFRIRANGLFYTNNQGPGANNIFMGNLAGQNTTGALNAGIGLNALQTNTTGFGNSALGSYALFLNLTGYENTAVGIEALRNNNSGYGNTSVGERSGYNNTTAYGNTSIGRYSIYNNQVGIENVGVGDSVLFGTSTDVGDYNVAVGNRVLFKNTGLRNVGIGYLALYNNTTASNNVAIGNQALTNNTSGISNVGIGTYALNDHTQGTYNIGIGYYAGKGITTGDYNTALGPYTMYSARDNGTISNVAAGYQALYTDTLPTYNVSIGMYSMLNGNLRDQNVAIGYYALRGNPAATGVARNIAIGTYSGYNITTGDDNVFMGTSSGRNNTTGAFNVFVGNNTGFTNTLGDKNVYIGDHSGFSATNADQNVFIGDHAGYLNTTGFFNAYVGFEAGRNNVLGQQNAFFGWWAGLNQKGDFNTFLGALTGTASSTGDGNTLIGATAGNGITTGNQNTFVGWAADASGNFNNSAAYGYIALVNNNNKIRLGNAAVTVIEGQPLNYTGLSDGRFKKDLKDDVVGLNFIMKLKPVSYNFDKIAYNNFINKNRKDTLPGMTEILKEQSKIRQSGFVAQDMEKARIEAGYNSFDAVSKPEDEEDGTWGIAYGTLVVPLVKSVQELNAKNIELEKQNSELKSLFDQYKSQSSKEIEDLKKIVESLKTKLDK